jgi:mono/diheme cytochrome c family protein
LSPTQALFRRAVFAGISALALFGLVAAGCGTADTQTDGQAAQEAGKFALNSPASTEPTTVSKPTTGSGQETEQVTFDGRQLFADNCAVCHGTAGEGQADWKQRNPDGSLRAPAHDPTGHTWHHTDGLLFRIVRDGGLPNLGVTSGMPAFGETLSPAQIVAVIDYLKTLWGLDERDFQAEVTANSGDRFP